MRVGGVRVGSVRVGAVWIQAVVAGAVGVGGVRVGGVRVGVVRVGAVRVGRAPAVRHGLVTGEGWRVGTVLLGQVTGVAARLEVGRQGAKVQI